MSIIGIAFGKHHDKKWKRIDEDGSVLSPSRHQFNDHPIFSGITEEEINGQSMVRVPAFYYRHGTIVDGDLAGKKALWISPTPANGFERHPAFMHLGAPIDEFWIGKYQGVEDQGRLASKPGRKPFTNIDFDDIKSAAARNGDGWMLWSIYQLAAIQILALIEHGTPDLASVVGAGYVDGDGVRAVDDELVAQAAYRGITGLWGNVWQMLQGLQTNGDREWRIWDKAGRQDLIDTGIAAPENDWFHRRQRKAGADFDLGAVFLPKKTRDAQGDSGFGDYFWAWPDGEVAYHGGNWSSGAICGLFCLYVSNAASGSSTNVGGRLAKV
ncbi:hypothetical protein [Castellaniella denitrificans]|uniref:hypothetical protein n=1 Tax=Castellaniella denitrificans TaxID=56119 RepID=UPI003622E1F4